MKILVIGGAGFLGSHVADALLDAGHRVTLFDLKPSAYLRPGQKMVVGNIQDQAAVSEVLKGHSVVYNFAGYADIESAQKHPLETIQSNVWGNGVILDACRRFKVKRYVFASSVYVYSNSPSFYRASKQACEAYIEVYRQLHGVPYTILRFGSLYGPRANPQNSIRSFLSQALKNGFINYWGTGEEMRDYIDVRDAALCCVDVLNPSFKNQCSILTGPQPLRVKDLLVMIREILGNKPKINFQVGSRHDLSGLHYTMTPYAFVPMQAKKMIRTNYYDLGQGLISMLDEIQRNDFKRSPL